MRLSPNGDRECAFGLEDHVRIYGRDYKDRLAQAEFTVTVDSYAQDLGSDVRKKYGLKPKDIYFCTKPNPTPESITRL